MSTLGKIAAHMKPLRFAVLYAMNIGNRFQRQTLAAIDGPKFYKRRVSRKYLTADPTFAPVPLTPEFERHLQALREDGICNIDGHFVDAAKRLRAEVNSMGLSGFRNPKDVVDFDVDVGFVFPEVLRMFAHPQLCGLLCNYYGRQAYYREHPRLVGCSAGDAGVERSSSHVHCDGYRQISMTLFLDDINESDTHLEYYRGTHKTLKLDYTREAQAKELVAGREAIIGTGRAGTLSLFDAGSGLHKGVYTTGQRVLLIQMVTTGWLPFRDPQRADREVLQVALKHAPSHVRGMFAR